MESIRKQEVGEVPCGWDDYTFMKAFELISKNSKNGHDNVPILEMGKLLQKAEDIARGHVASGVLWMEGRWRRNLHPHMDVWQQSPRD